MSTKNTTLIAILLTTGALFHVSCKSTGTDTAQLPPAGADTSAALFTGEKYYDSDVVDLRPEAGDVGYSDDVDILSLPPEPKPTQTVASASPPAPKPKAPAPATKKVASKPKPAPKKEVAKAAPKPKPVPVPKEHLIAKGDTLYALSRKYSVNVAEIKKLNKLKDNTIVLGKTILIP